MKPHVINLVEATLRFCTCRLFSLEALNLWVPPEALASMCRSVRPAFKCRMLTEPVPKQEPGGYRNCFDYASSVKDLTVHCPSMIVALTQMSWFRVTGLGAGNVQAKTCGPASGPYINHHMSSRWIKNVQLVLFTLDTEWQQIHFCILSPQHFMNLPRAESFSHMTS